MRRSGLVLMVVGFVFLLSGVAAVAWAASQASAMSEEDKALDPEQYDFYVSAQNCSMGSVIIGLIITVIGVIVGRRKGHAVEESQGRLRTEGV